MDLVDFLRTDETMTEACGEMQPKRRRDFSYLNEAPMYVCTSYVEGGKSILSPGMWGPRKKMKNDKYVDDAEEKHVAERADDGFRMGEWETETPVMKEMCVWKDEVVGGYCKEGYKELVVVQKIEFGRRIKLEAKEWRAENLMIKCVMEVCREMNFEQETMHKAVLLCIEVYTKISHIKKFSAAVRAGVCVCIAAKMEETTGRWPGGPLQLIIKLRERVGIYMHEEIPKKLFFSMELLVLKSMQWDCFKIVTTQEFLQKLFMLFSVSEISAVRLKACIFAEQSLLDHRFIFSEPPSNVACFCLMAAFDTQEMWSNMPRMTLYSMLEETVVAEHACYISTDYAHASA